MKNTKLLAFIAFIFISTYSQAQNENFSDQEKEVLEVVNRLFDGMRKGDSTMVRSVFHASARMQTTYTNAKTGLPVIQTEENPDKFVKAVGTPHEKIWDERILSYKIDVDDNMAIVWTPYEFYAGDTFSHCGVNAFQFFKSEEGWKIIQITDTRRKTPCNK